MTKFAARFGYRRQDLKDDPLLHQRLMMRYAREHGHDPAGLKEWTMIVSPDGQVQFYPYFVSEDSKKEYDRGWADRTPLSNSPEPL